MIVIHKHGQQPQDQPATSVIVHLAANLRASDLEEYAATFGQHVDRATTMAAIFQSPGYAFTAWYQGEPVLAFGVLIPPGTPHIGVAWGFGTDRARKAMPRVSRFIQDELIPELLNTKVRRVEVRVLHGNQSSLEWLTAHMDANLECLLRDFGANGETFIQLAWTKGRITNVFRPTSSHTGARQD